MNKRFILIAFLGVISLSSYAQKKITWAWIAENIKFEEKFFPEAGLYILAPNFKKPLLDLEGKEVVISGYIMPLDEEMNFYALSANSFAKCFFCGGAGPETVASLDFRNKTLRFKTDEFHTVKGRLRLNVEELEDAFIILEDVELYVDYD